jgi:hypothetical protein
MKKAKKSRLYLSLLSNLEKILIEDNDLLQKLAR